MRSKRWPMIIVALLCVHTGAMVYAVVLCSRGNAAVIPDYYDKAVRYDEFKAARQRASQAAEAAERGR